ncbi:unnamed protein product [Arctia plantaginis]|uniref:Cuticle protein CPCFC domain-containing protein n=1 Tax=Arctia plantaginis TaxID=874455 RepID=A0A8S1A960_ARCPL|nr:unnamed protein product [Arctia plantaginis]CAB3261995.1 unnamed protein product [Arctia plantaginis]
MFAKLLVIFALAAVALAHDRYPAGLHPAVCPNYPYCDADALARHTPGGQPIPQWQYPAAAYAAAAAPAAPVAHRYPADVSPAMCPNYPYCF